MKRQERITIRCTPSEKEAIAMASRAVDETISEFIRDPAVQRAKKLLLIEKK